MEIIYSELNSEFKLLDYSLSHSQLLLRSMKNKKRSYNIDIIFKGVNLLILSELFKGIEIMVFSSINDVSYNSFLKKIYIDNGNNYKKFNIKTNDGQEFFIKAFSFGIYHNKLEILESSIGRYDESNLEEKILFYK